MFLLSPERSERIHARSNRRFRRRWDVSRCRGKGVPRARLLGEERLRSGSGGRGEGCGGGKRGGNAVRNKGRGGGRWLLLLRLAEGTIGLGQRRLLLVLLTEGSTSTSSKGARRLRYKTLRLSLLLSKRRRRERSGWRRL
jgi:hypothetical protein